MLYLRNVKGFGWNHKRVFNLRIKPRQRLIRKKPAERAVPQQANECWSMDFMHDQLSDSRSVRLFNVIDDFNREAWGDIRRIDIDFLLPAQHILRSQEQAIEWRAKPKAIRCDNGPEYTSKLLQDWAEKHQIQLLHIQPGNPQQNVYIERFNRTVRYDWLGHYLFKTHDELQEFATQWPWVYNNERPNMALKDLPPLHLAKVA